jgi:hypothetical protein
MSWALDGKNQVLFAACGRSGNPPAQPAKPMMVVLNAKDGKILANLPLAGGSDGAVFNPATMEVFSTHGNGTMTIVKEMACCEPWTVFRSPYRPDRY